MRGFIGTLLAAGLVAGPALAQEPDLAAQVEASREAVKAFSARLMGELQAAMAAGGPTNAVEVCHGVAQAIAAEESRRRGWKVGRTSLRVRNPKNAPDAWERETLTLFEQQKAAGADVGSLERYALAQVQGRSQFRYMKAIPTGGICLACHGDRVAPEAAALIRRHYPDDRATGFRLGDLRGAFTIARSME